MGYMRPYPKKWGGADTNRSKSRINSEKLKLEAQVQGSTLEIRETFEIGKTFRRTSDAHSFFFFFFFLQKLLGNVGMDCRLQKKKYTGRIIRINATKVQSQGL